MNWLRSSLLIFVGAAAAAEEISMPSWEEGDRDLLEDEGWSAGADLLLLENLESLPRPILESGVGLPASAEIASDGEQVNLLPEKFFDAYFAQRPEGFLVDPQGLLDEEQRVDRDSFLNYHSMDSKVDFFVYLFPGDQQIPGEVRDEELAERFFTDGKPALVLFYYFGQPQRSELYLSSSLSERIPDSEKRRALQTAVLAGSSKSDPMAQLQAFSVQTSIRIYWLEKAAGLEDEKKLASGPLVMAPPVDLPEGPTRSERTKEIFRSMWAEWGLPLLVLSGAALSGSIMLVISSRRTKHRFPEFEVAPRMGGDHAAGIGALMGFGSTTQSPSTQKNDIPGYLGGI